MKRDVIYRDDAIEAAYQGLRRPSDDPVWIAILDRLTAQPSAQPEQRWIPCSERLPEPLQEVIVTSTQGHVYTSRIVHGNFEYGGDVVAWMPLPEPYKEGE